MHKYKIFITRPIPESGIRLLRQYKLPLSIRQKNSIISRAELLRNISDVQILVSILTDQIDKEILARAKKLKMIANFGAGYNNIDVKEATKRGILATNTPDVLTIATAEHTIGLMLAAARRIVEGDKFMRLGKFKGWGPIFFLGTGVYGKTLGIIGCGRIGTEVARIAEEGLRMKILYYNPKRNKAVERLGGKKVSLAKLLQDSDFVSLHVPLTPKTHHLISAKELRLMKRDAFLINTSRGSVVNEEILVLYLQQKRIAGAALDVFENEPKLTPGLEKLDNVVLAPHTGSATWETRNRMSELVAKNVLAFLQGKKPPNLVNPEALKNNQYDETYV